MEWQLRRARAEDAQGVVATVKEVYEEYGFTWEAEGYHADLYDLSEYLDGENGAFWVAESSGEIVGCGGWCLTPELAGTVSGEVVTLDDQVRVGGAQAEVVRMYVRPSARRNGIARAIMRAILDDATARGWSLLEIWSDKRFTEAHLLYEAFGAVRVGDRICADPDLAPEWGFKFPIM